MTLKMNAQECIDFMPADPIDYHPDTCEGDVFYHSALSGSGLRYARCEKHFDEYVERVQPKLDEIAERYPDTELAPSWFDPTYAGESWNDDY
jgi:hypothetical protein